MSKRYIDANVLIEDLVHNRSFYPAIVSSAIKNTPTADVVEVVRCKDCVSYNDNMPTRPFCDYWGACTASCGYCAFGKRSENGT